MDDLYPYEDGNTIVLGPEIFASKDGRLICWRGENYIRQTTEWDKLCPEAQDDLIQSGYHPAPWVDLWMGI